jgi:hypothetical protein
VQDKSPVNIRGCQSYHLRAKRRKSIRRTRSESSLEAELEVAQSDFGRIGRENDAAIAVDNIVLAMNMKPI